jgi:hypothetical protein
MDGNDKKRERTKGKEGSREGRKEGRKKGKKEKTIETRRREQERK